MLKKARSLARGSSQRLNSPAQRRQPKLVVWRYYRTSVVTPAAGRNASVDRGCPTREARDSMAPKKPKVVAEALLYAKPEIECVIAESPGLEDDEDPLLEPETQQKVHELFDGTGERNIPSSDAKKLLKDLGVVMDDARYARLVDPYVRAFQSNAETLSRKQFMDVARHVLAPAVRYGARLRKAASRGDLERVKDYIARGCDGKGSDGLGFTAVHCAAQHNRAETVKALINEICGKGYCNAQDERGWSPLHVCAAEGRLETLQLLLGLGSDASLKTVHGRTPLHWACAKGRLECVEALLKGKADLKAGDEAGMTALHLAAQHGHLEVCQRLIKAKASPEAENTLGRRPADFQDAEFWAAALA